MISFSLSPNRSVSVSDIADALEISKEVILTDLQKTAKDHYSRFGTQAIQLFFDPIKGYCVRNTSVVGMLKTPNFVLELQPKIKGLDIGKCLGLAQISGVKDFQLSDKSLKNLAINNDSDVSLVDYFGYSLVDAIIQISHNGLISKPEFRASEPAKLRGSILINESINAGKIGHKPVILDSENSQDIAPNQILKSALKFCADNCMDSDLQGLASNLMSLFREVGFFNTDNFDEVSIKSIGKYFSSPRPDYENALIHAYALLEGGVISGEDGKLNSPSFSIDLDKVFEAFCSIQLHQLMNKDLYDVLLQPTYDHVMEPNIAEKKIIPDVLVKSKSADKGIIIDLKNKYSELREDGGITMANPDVFQLSYYSKSFGFKDCILVYPSYKPKVQYPIKGAESDEAYKSKCSAKLEQILEQNSVTLFNDRSTRVIIYNIDLSGSMRNSIRSVAGLSQLVADLMRANNGETA